MSLFGTFIDATVGQMVHAFSGPRPSPPSWEAGPPLEPAPDDGGGLRDGTLKLVRYTLVSLRPCEERILGTGEVMVQGGRPVLIRRRQTIDDLVALES